MVNFNPLLTMDEILNQLSAHYLNINKGKHNSDLQKDFLENLVENFNRELEKTINGIKPQPFITLSGISIEAIEYLVETIQCMTDGKNTICIPYDQFDRIPDYIKNTEFNISELRAQGAMV